MFVTSGSLSLQGHDVQVLLQRIRWTEGHQAPSDSQPANRVSEGATPTGQTTVSDLLEYQDPQTGLTPLMAAVVKGYLAITRQVSIACYMSFCCIAILCFCAFVLLCTLAQP